MKHFSWVLLLAACAEAPPAAPEPPPYNGRQGGYLGMFLREVSPTELRVDAVDPGSCAEAAGFRAGDVIKEIRSKAQPMVKSPGPLTKMIMVLWQPMREEPVFDVGRAEIRTTLAKLDARPAPGEVAPDFTLKTKEGRAVTLSEACRERPVVLIFGSWT